MSADYAAVAAEVDSANYVNNILDGWGNGDAESLVNELLDLGWKYNKNVYSKCSVASYEANLIKGNRRLNVVASNLFGRFVDVSG